MILIKADSYIMRIEAAYIIKSEVTLPFPFLHTSAGAAITKYHRWIIHSFFLSS
jgi:hypothetical protein